MGDDVDVWEVWLVDKDEVTVVGPRRIHGYTAQFAEGFGQGMLDMFKQLRPGDAADYFVRKKTDNEAIDVENAAVS